MLCIKEKQMRFSRGMNVKTQRMTEKGVKALWRFSHTNLSCREQFLIQEPDLCESEAGGCSTECFQVKLSQCFFFPCLAISHQPHSVKSSSDQRDNLCTRQHYLFYQWHRHFLMYNSKEMGFMVVISSDFCIQNLKYEGQHMLFLLVF